jgi:hypothetical protein
LTLDPDPGVLDNEGTVEIKSDGKLINQHEVNNKGKIVNEGEIVNEGKIYNSEGTIKSNGIFKSVQTAEEMGGKITGNPVQSIGGGGDGGGCSTGIGILPLILGGLIFYRKRHI